MEIASGTVIVGRYRLDRLLGQGGMGEVWSAQHMVTRRSVALKFLSVPDHVMAQMRRRFLREARAAAAVNHPNVITIHDVFEADDGTPVMVMDLLLGEPFGDKLGREGALSVAETARIMAPVVSAVGTAHSLGVVHRDLKPENIFLCKTAEGGLEVKVLDFGIAKLSLGIDSEQTNNITGTGAVLGTPYYMAIEQAFGERDIDHRADMWAIGIILYESLLGDRPIRGDNFGQIVKQLTGGKIPPIQSVVPNVPDDLAELIGSLLQRDRDQRPADLRGALTVLRRYTDVLVRTFDGARAPAPLSVIEAPEALGDSAVIVVGGGARDKDHLSATADLGESDIVLPRGGKRSRTPMEERANARRAVTTPSNARRSPAGNVRVMSAEDAQTADPASPTPAVSANGGNKRTAVIAGVGAGVGVLVALAAIFAFRSPPPMPTPVPEPARSATPAASAAMPTPTVAAVAQPAPSGSSIPAVAVTVAPATGDPAGAATAAAQVDAGASVGGRPRLGGPLPAGAKTATPTATAAPGGNKGKGGLVDEPPF